MTDKMNQETDRELLEFAAKAAGIEPSTFEGRDVGWHVPGRGVGAWNPLTDDGDALRLAVGLGLDVYIYSRQEDWTHTHVIGFRDEITTITVDAIENHGDPYAATRRAIVRAAAEIGRFKGEQK